MRRLLTIILTVLVLPSAAVLADTFHVSATTGSIGGTGTPGDPFLTIQQGLDAAAMSGDTVLVQPGTYTGAGNRDLATLGKAVIVRGQMGAAATIINVGSVLHDGFFLDDTGEDENTRIEGFTVRNGRHGVRLRLDGTAPALDDLVLEANTTAGVSYALSGFTGFGIFTIENCEFRNHPAAAVDLGILEFAKGRDPFVQIRDCEFTGNAIGLRVSDVYDPNCQVEDSVFDGNDLAAFGVFALLRCEIVGGVDGCDGNLEMPPHNYTATDCLFENLTGTVFLDAAGVTAAGCTIRNNLGDVHAGGPDEEEYEVLTLTGCEITGNGGGLILGSTQATLVITDCLYADNAGPVRYTTFGGFASCTITGSTFADNTGTALEIPQAIQPVTVENSIIAGNGGIGIDWQSAPATWTIGCNDVWNNAGGDYVGLPDQTGLNQNISGNPRFCDPSAGDYSLRSDSPCLPGMTGCGLMGALGEGCLLPTTWFVATWGSDLGGDGSAGSPFRHVQFAIDIAADSDTVIVHDGTYPEALSITRGLLLRSLSGDPQQCVLAGVPDHRVLTISATTDTVRLRDLDITGGAPTLGDYAGISPGGGVLAFGPPVVMTGCRVYDNRTPTAETGTAGGGIHVRDGSYLRLVDCEIFDNASARAGGLITRSSEALEMYGCLVHHNRSDRQAGGVWILPAALTPTTYVLAGNTIAHNEATIEAGGVQAYLADLDMAANIVAFNVGGASQVRLDDCTGAMTCNDVFDPAGGPDVVMAPPLPRPSDIAADPWFCRKFYGDYTLLAISPCAAAISPCGRIGARDVGCTFTDATPPPVPEATTLLPPHPNPFNAHVSLGFVLASPALVRLDVLDLRGRLVRSVICEERPAGGHAETWTGIDDTGRAVASGLYLVRLRAGDVQRTQRVALIK